MTWRNSFPTIPIARTIRDTFLATYRGLLRQRSYAAVRADKRTVKTELRIRFAGLFDTVEAYGVPIEEMRTAIDKAIWPISFRNRVLSDKVDFARHALALDDERTTFHPLRFDMTHEGPWAANARIKEVWFAGVHSDVGGGYPDADLAYVPLVWMADHAVKHGNLRFTTSAIATFLASALGPRHDSRAGLGVFYRYEPRIIHDDVKHGGPPVIHHAVARGWSLAAMDTRPL